GRRSGRGRGRRRACPRPFAVSLPPVAVDPREDVARADPDLAEVLGEAGLAELGERLEPLARDEALHLDARQLAPYELREVLHELAFFQVGLHLRRGRGPPPERPPGRV